MIDVTGEISAVRREVGGRVLEAGAAPGWSRLSRSYPAELADVWDACTNPERIPRWFLPVSGELKEGGRYQLEGNAGGIVTRCDPPHGFDATWEMGGDVSWIELRLADEGNGRTLFRLDHIALVDDERWAQFGPGRGRGGLGQRPDRPVPAPDVPGSRWTRPRWPTWSASGEGHQFLTASSDAWCQASVASGTDPAAARAAADRTTAFYTGITR